MILDSALVMKATPSANYKLLIAGKLLRKSIGSQILVLKNRISPGRSASQAGKTRAETIWESKRKYQHKVIVLTLQKGGCGKRFYIITN